VWNTSIDPSGDQADVEVQHDHRPLVRVEALEHALDLVAIGERDGPVVDDGLDRAEVHGDRRAAPGALRLAVAGTHEEAAEPGVEPVRVAQGRAVAPGGDERLLHGILGPAGSRRIRTAMASSRPIRARASSANAS
jgi:hypothetical protein